MELSSPAPLGVFDSGLGGLSVAREIRRLLPRTDIVYLGDTAHVPYGGRSEEEVRAFTLSIGRYLVERQRVRALVLACNTATSAAAEALRASVPVPVVAMEPGIKPAARATRTGRIGVLATHGTLASARLGHLVRRFASGIEVITQPCPGLVEAVEAGEFSAPQTRALVRAYVAPLVARGVDALVLGCTHYPLLLPLLAEAAGPGVTLIDTGPAVARRVAQVAGPDAGAGQWALWATGRSEGFARGASQILGEAVSPGRVRWRRGEIQETE